MSVKYKLYQDNRATSKFKGMWYARSVVTDVTDLNKLAERIERNCTAKKSDVLAVLTELVETMQDELQASHRVKLNGFGSFKMGLATSPAKTAKDFTATTNVKSLHVLFQPELKISTDGVRTKTFLSGVKVEETSTYTVNKTVTPNP
jgi:predicted histone-like DNA-binding protein